VQIFKAEFAAETIHFEIPLTENGIMQFTSDGQRLVVLHADHRIRIWQTKNGSLEQTVPTGEFSSASLFPNGRTAFLTREDRFWLFDIGTAKAIPTEIPAATINAHLFDLTGERFVTIAEEKWARVWNSHNAEPLTPPISHNGALQWVDWSPDGKRIVMAGATPEIQLWDAENGELGVAPMRLGSGAIQIASWSPDGRFIVARSDDKAARVWDAATGEAITPILQHSNDVLVAQMLANGRLVTVSAPNLLRAWDLKECSLSLSILTDLSHLLAGRTINSHGVIRSLRPKELAELSRSLREQAPQLFK
jgi:dipeptidyl aminopeptidase/acylaminoacyl peptidase